MLFSNPLDHIRFLLRMIQFRWNSYRLARNRKKKKSGWMRIKIERVWINNYFKNILRFMLILILNYFLLYILFIQYLSRIRVLFFSPRYVYVMNMISNPPPPPIPDTLLEFFKIYPYTLRKWRWIWWLEFDKWILLHYAWANEM